VLSDCKNFSLIEKFGNSSRVSVVLPQVGCEFLGFATVQFFWDMVPHYWVVGA